jgi:hypothetical protein
MDPRRTRSGLAMLTLRISVRTSNGTVGLPPRAFDLHRQYKRKSTRCFLGAVRRRTFICCRNIQTSTSSAVRDRNRSATIQTVSLTISLIPQQQRPILDQLLVRLSLR